MDVVEAAPTGAGKLAKRTSAGWAALTVTGAAAFWFANLLISLTPTAAAYRSALSIRYLPMLLRTARRRRRYAADRSGATVRSSQGRLVARRLDGARQAAEGLTSGAPLGRPSSVPTAVCGEAGEPLLWCPRQFHDAADLPHQLVVVAQLE